MNEKEKFPNFQLHSANRKFIHEKFFVDKKQKANTWMWVSKQKLAQLKSHLREEKDKGIRWKKMLTAQAMREKHLRN